MKITLEERPSAGYIWTTEPKLEHVFKPSNDSVGSGGTVTFAFCEEKLPIRFCYGRPWEPDSYKKVFVLMEEN